MLQQISTLFGRLEFLASLRDAETGIYCQAALAQVVESADLDSLLRHHHKQIFSEWLASSLQDQKEDLTEYLESSGGGSSAGLRLARLAAHAELIPPGARPVERQLYLTDWETLLELLCLGSPGEPSM
jgi:hypothetical protein